MLVPIPQGAPTGAPTALSSGVPVSPGFRHLSPQAQSAIPARRPMMSLRRRHTLSTSANVAVLGIAERNRRPIALQQCTKRPHRHHRDHDSRGPLLLGTLLRPGNWPRPERVTDHAMTGLPFPQSTPSRHLPPAHFTHNQGRPPPQLPSRSLRTGPSTPSIGRRQGKEAPGDPAALGKRLGNSSRTCIKRCGPAYPAPVRPGWSARRTTARTRSAPTSADAASPGPSPNASTRSAAPRRGESLCRLRAGPRSRGHLAPIGLW